MNQRKVKLLYIAGPSRSGSTLLSNILGEIDGFFNAGELIDIWDRGISLNGRCGCGAPVNTCEIWSKVIDKAFRGLTQEDICKMIFLRDRTTRSHHVPLRLLTPGKIPRLNIQLKDYLNNLERLYKTIQDITDCKVIIDSSKNAWYAQLLKMISEIDLYLLHFIRDPRATAFSWLRKKEGLRRDNPLKSSFVWSSRNIVSEMLGRRLTPKYLRLYYENFVAYPRETIKKILHLVQEEPVSLPFESTKEVKLGTNHCIYGNPNRFQSGIFKIEADDEWKSSKRNVRLLVTVLTWPLLMRYNYSILPRLQSAQ